ncbi:helix-turn-helix domain-containing protein [Niabella beijingensis]|uniref:helix-turn-helix domain-containing protein n=1 Tax=Niabella beijingensis TaxID=2872700 RepID=UPI001CC1191E|nr:AraC family transcriptional regulator [Niabella beijingensis]MBZ4188769.1 AraC family transcriptional regulator [Niabella beijingensis]
MSATEEIIRLSFKDLDQSASLELVSHRVHQIPGAVQYEIKRFSRSVNILTEDMGMLVYEYNSQKPKENNLKLKFCLAGNMYCARQDCSNCTAGRPKDCADSTDSVDVVSVQFTPSHLSQFIKSRTSNSFSDSLLKFKHKLSFTRTLPLCCKTKTVIEGLLGHSYNGTLENIYVNAQLQMLLLLTMDSMADDKELEVISCKFLSNEADKDKVEKAREILIKHIGEPITIKELSRKVAMNECYLKKGFKEMYGSTIFDFYQNQRMEHAKYLLYEKGLSVTDVSMMLGYSSISHFSTAFKRLTGLKPCELLFASR